MTRHRLAAVVANLPPGAFAIVMATGIVSDAMRRLGLGGLARVLFWLNVGCYGVISILLLCQLLAFPDRIVADLRDARRAPDLMTIAAGSSVLGAQLVLFEGSVTAGAILWLIGIAAWIVVIYGLLILQATLARKQGLGEGFDGDWLLVVVATEAISVLGSILAGHSAAAREVVLGCALLFFLLGGLLYAALLALLLQRLLFFPLTPEALTPPYWVSMGAAAITTFAGSLLARHAELWPLLELLLPFVAGLAILFWAVATWWIPLLLLLGSWRHLRHRIRLRYNTRYWAIVFPVGMYAVATFRLYDDVGWGLLVILGHIFGYAALAAWALAAVGLVRSARRAIT
jgi:tellurite resistance protein TehA-like permease